MSTKETQIFDLDALENEAEGRKPFQFSLGGDVFELPFLMDMDWQDQLRLETSPETDAVRVILGDQYKKFEQHKCSVRQLKALIEAWMQHQGVDPGKSPRSSTLSANTGPKSKRTSHSGR